MSAVPSVLLPAPLRRPVAVVVATAVAVFAALAVRFAGTSAAGRVDTRVDAVVDPVGAAHHWLVDHAVALGSPPSVVVLSLALALVCLFAGRYRLAVMAVAGPGLTGLCTTLLKPALGRTLDGGYAFPSGHTGGATALGLVAALLVISVVRPGRGGALAILAAGALVAGGGVGAAMIAADAHYPTDVVGGFCTAVTVVCGGALLLDRVAAARTSPHGRDGD